MLLRWVWFFKVMGVVFQVMATNEIDDSWKQLCLEFIVTVAENGEWNAEPWRVRA